MAEVIGINKKELQESIDKFLDSIDQEFLRNCLYTDGVLLDRIQTTKPYFQE